MDKTVAELIRHPEALGEDTLYGLRELVARYPYYQAARLLFLHNLFLLHDASFGAELRRAAVYLPDRRVLFRMVEGANYEIKRKPSAAAKDKPRTGDRTQSLIDDFLSQTSEATREELRHPTVADAVSDYTAYLLQMDDAAPTEDGGGTEATADRSAQLIEGFMENGGGRIRLPENPDPAPVPDTTDTPDTAAGGAAETDESEAGEDGFLTMTLARIYIKQQRYEKALEIMRKVGAASPKKQAYFADQVRFLQKLIVNNSHSHKP